MPFLRRREKKIRARGAAIAAAIERSKSTGDLQNFSVGDDNFDDADRGRRISTASAASSSSTTTAGSYVLPPTPAPRLRNAKSDGCLTSRSYQEEIALRDSPSNLRHFSRGYQEHLKIVSDAAVTRSPLKKKQRRKSGGQMTPLSKSRSGSVVSLVSLAVPSLAQSSPELPIDEVIELSLLSGLTKAEVEDRFLQFHHLTEGRPHKGLNVKQFLELYRRSYPRASPSAPSSSSSASSRLGSSVFRLIDADADGVVSFKEYLLSLCIPSHWIPTTQKFRTLFRIFDASGRGHLGPGVLATAVRDLYDLLGLLGVNGRTNSRTMRDPHRHAMGLFARMDRDKSCKVSESEFVRVALSDVDLVSLAEEANFCVPSSLVFVGKSSFFSETPRRNPDPGKMRHAYSEVNFFHSDSDSSSERGGDRKGSVDVLI